MSTKRELLLSNEALMKIGCGVLSKDQVRKSRVLQSLFNAKFLGAFEVREIYEAARAKDADLIQRLVDAIEPDDCHHPYCAHIRHAPNPCDCHMAALAEAAAAGFKPTEQ